jgi:hypothetical protein
MTLILNIILDVGIYIYHYLMSISILIFDQHIYLFRHFIVRDLKIEQTKRLDIQL